MLFYGVAVCKLPGENGRKGIDGKYRITFSLPHCCLRRSLLILETLPEDPLGNTPRRPARRLFYYSSPLRHLPLTLPSSGLYFSHSTFATVFTVAGPWFPFHGKQMDLPQPYNRQPIVVVLPALTAIHAVAPAPLSKQWCLLFLLSH